MMIAVDIGPQLQGIVTIILAILKAFDWTLVSLLFAFFLHGIPTNTPTNARGVFPHYVASPKL